MPDPIPQAAAGSRRPVLQVVDVTKTYFLDEVEVHALCGVSLDVCEGEMLSIMGPSGSGKSTLMHIIGLLDHPTSGRVIVEGEDVVGMTPNQLAAVRNQRIGFVFQSFNLLAAHGRAGERRASADLLGRVRERARATRARGARARGPRRPAAPLLEPAVRRAAAARRHRARARHEPVDRARGRADRQPRLAFRHRGHGAAAGPQRGRASRSSS